MCVCQCTNVWIHNGVIKTRRTNFHPASCVCVHVCVCACEHVCKGGECVRQYMNVFVSL